MNVLNKIWNWIDPHAGNSGRGSSDRSVASTSSDRSVASTAARAGRRASEVQWPDLNGTINAWTSVFSGVAPPVDSSIIQFLINAGYVNREMKTARENIKHLTLTKLKTTIEGRTEGDVRRIHGRLNDLAARIEVRNSGINALTHDWIDQMILTGAISTEFVLSSARDAIIEGALVPTQNIKFKLENGVFVPYQQRVNFATGNRTGSEIRLDTPFYKYRAAERLPGSPYGVPLFLAAINDIIMNMDIDTNVKFILRKMGLLGLVMLMMNPPDDYDPNDPDQVANFNAQISQRLTDFADNYYDGIAVMPNDTEVQTHSPAGEARGATEIMDRKQQDAFMAAGFNPMLAGRTSHSAYEFAKIIYILQVRNSESYQNIISDLVTTMQCLDLMVGGLDATGVRAVLDKNPAFDPLSEAQAYTTQMTGDIRAMEKGLIHPDEVAEKYYDHPAVDPARAFDGVSGNGAFLSDDGRDGHDRHPLHHSSGESSEPRLRRVELEIKNGRYDVVRGRVNLWTGKKKLCDVDGVPLDPPRKPGGRDYGGLSGRNVRPTELRQDPEDDFGERVRAYLKSVKPLTDEAREQAVDAAVRFLERNNRFMFLDESDFAEKAWQEIVGAFGGAMSLEDAEDAVDGIVRESYTHYRLKDKSAWGAQGSGVSFVWDNIDDRAVGFVKSIDQMYLSTFIESDQSIKRGQDFLQQAYLSNGAGLFGRADEAVLQEFKTALGGTIDELTNYQVQRIADTSVVRMRSYAHLNQMRELDVEQAAWVTVGGACDICSPFDGQVFRIANSLARMDMELGLTPSEFAEYIKTRRVAAPSSNDDVTGMLDGGVAPPLHPNCRCRLRVWFEGLSLALMIRLGLRL